MFSTYGSAFHECFRHLREKKKKKHNKRRTKQHVYIPTYILHNLQKSTIPFVVHKPSVQSESPEAPSKRATRSRTPAEGRAGEVAGVVESLVPGEHPA